MPPLGPMAAIAGWQPSNGNEPLASKLTVLFNGTAISMLIVKEIAGDSGGGEHAFVHRVMCAQTGKS